MKTSLSITLTWLVCGVGSAATPQDAVRKLAAAPLRFEAANGSSAQFVARGARYRFSFTGSQAIVQQNGRDVRLRFEGARPHVQLEGIDKLRSTTNMFLGNDPARWRRGIPSYGRIQVQDLYPGVNLVYYGNAGELESDLNVKSAADPTQINLRISGTGLIQNRPVAYR